MCFPTDLIITVTSSRCHAIVVRPLEQVWEVHSGVPSAMCYLDSYTLYFSLVKNSLNYGANTFLCDNYFWVLVSVNFWKQWQFRLSVKCSVTFMQHFMLDIYQKVDVTVLFTSQQICGIFIQVYLSVKIVLIIYPGGHGFGIKVIFYCNGVKKNYSPDLQQKDRAPACVWPC